MGEELPHNLMQIAVAPKQYESSRFYQNSYFNGKIYSLLTTRLPNGTFNKSLLVIDTFTGEQKTYYFYKSKNSSESISLWNFVPVEFNKDAGQVYGVLSDINTIERTYYIYEAVLDFGLEKGWRTKRITSFKTRPMAGIQNALNNTRFYKQYCLKDGSIEHTIFEAKLANDEITFAKLCDFTFPCILDDWSLVDNMLIGHKVHNTYLIRNLETTENYVLDVPLMPMLSKSMFCIGGSLRQDDSTLKLVFSTGGSSGSSRSNTGFAELNTNIMEFTSNYQSVINTADVNAFKYIFMVANRSILANGDTQRNEVICQRLPMRQVSFCCSVLILQVPAVPNPCRC
ncbi:hypothetical protein M3Y97_00725800 [Aphelenchoides bicaudatus]|nr:hypothetical protein M3Y97_00725800 [Aphelenchoides bicaudatus]